MRKSWDSQHAESVNGRGYHSAASSSSYHVFINHRGPDTKRTFVTHLVDELIRENLKPFVDMSIDEGLHAFEEIEAAIQHAPVLLAIFSPGYAESEHCLRELVAMLKRRGDNPAAVTVVPVFFNVRPRDLRCAGSSLDNPFYAAFEEHKNNFLENPISDWATALRTAASLKGFELAEFNGDTNELKKRIVARVVELIRLGSGLGSTSQNNRLITESSEISRTSTPRAQQEDVKSSLRILVIGDSADRVVNYICGEGRWQTSVQNFVGSWTSSPPMCLYHHRTNTTDHMQVLKAFMGSWNERWSGKRVVSSCLDRIHQRRQYAPPSEHSDLRLHMVWLVCQRCSDLPDQFKWTKIMKTLTDLPIQIVVTPGETPGETLASEYRKILDQGNGFFPNSQNPEELILKLDMGLTDWDPQENLLRTWKSRFRAEIANAACIIWEIRKELGSEGISVGGGVGNRGTPQNVSLSVSGNFLLNFLGKYWEVPDVTFGGVLNELGPFYNQGLLKIPRYQFVKFCLQAAAIILYNMPRYGNLNDVSNWRDITTECCDRYFRATDRIYDAMKCDDIQAFLLRVFEREEYEFRPTEGEHRSCCSCWSFIGTDH